MTVKIDRKWHYLPVIMLVISMVGGLYVFNATIERWVNKTMQGYLSGLLEDVVYQINEDKPDFKTLAVEGVADYISHLSQASTEKRISIISLDGTVLGDTSLSHRELSTLENHANRAEIMAAIKKGYGFDIRYSNTLQVNMLYVAKTTDIENVSYVVRLSMPMTLLVSMSSELMSILIILMSLSVAILIITTILSHHRIENRVLAEQALQEERIQQRTFEIELLHRLANMLAACNSLQEAQKVVEDIIPRILGNVNGSVALMRASRNQLSIKLDWGQSWPAAMSYSPDECWALRRGKHHFSNDQYHSLPCAHMAATGEDQTLCIPLTAHGNTIGMLHLYFGDKGTLVENETKQLAFTVAEHLGLALANLSLQEKLRSQALSDPLTGLFNRRYFEESIDSLLMVAKRDSVPLSLLMLDLDHFKRFNDNFGHDAGDYVLKEISGVLINTIGDDDVVCRLGGEELAIIAPGLNAQQAMALSATICANVEELHLNLKGLSLGKVTVSIGVATFPDSRVEQADLVKYADVALYKAKDYGRNRAVHYLEEREDSATPIAIHAKDS